MPTPPSFFTKVLNQTAMQVYWDLPSKPGQLEGFRLEYRGVSNPNIQGQETFPGHINTHTISHLGQYHRMNHVRYQYWLTCRPVCQCLC